MKILLVVMIVLVGAVVGSLIDEALGIQFKDDVELPRQVVHKTFYMVWGAIIVACIPYLP